MAVNSTQLNLFSVFFSTDFEAHLFNHKTRDLQQLLLPFFQEGLCGLLCSRHIRVDMDSVIIFVAHVSRKYDTVDGRNPAPPGMYFGPYK